MTACQRHAEHIEGNHRNLPNLCGKEGDIIQFAEGKEKQIP